MEKLSMLVLCVLLVLLTDKPDLSRRLPGKGGSK
jgi:hypothetical protein